MGELVNSNSFDTLCAVVIIINCLLIGLSVQEMTMDEEEKSHYVTAGHFCNVFFLIELVLRMSTDGLKIFFFDPEAWKWNVFDFLLVGFSVVDFMVSEVLKNNQSIPGFFGGGLKTIKMLRIIRIFRVFRFFAELGMLALMIMDSVRSLVWALVMLAIIIYVFGICFTQGASDWLHDLRKQGKPFDENAKQVERFFGSLPKTLYSLVMSMLNGISWGSVCDAVMQIDALQTILFFIYTTFTILAVLNIITGVFVDNAVETAKQEREFLVQKEMELREKYVDEMHDLFHEMDVDGSGTVTFEEVQEYFLDKRVQSYFQALGLDPTDTERLFRLIDSDGSEELSVDEFLDGCLRLKGWATSIDAHAIMYECKRLALKLDYMEEQLAQGDAEDDETRTRADSNTVVPPSIISTYNDIDAKTAVDMKRESTGVFKASSWLSPAKAGNYW